MVQVQTPQHLLKELLLLPFQMMPREYRRGVASHLIARQESVAPKHLVATLKTHHGKGEGFLALLRGVPNPAVLLSNGGPITPFGLLRRPPHTLRLCRRRAFQHARPFIVTHAPMGEPMSHNHL